MTTTATRPAIDLGDSLATRWQAATALLADRGNYSKATPGTIFVWTDTKGAPAPGYWTATATSCNCPDATVGQAARFLNGACKHTMAAWLIARQDATAAIVDLVAVREAAMSEGARQFRVARQAAALVELQELAG